MDYSTQIGVDPKRHPIAEQHAKVTDVGLMAQTAVAARANVTEERFDAVSRQGVLQDQRHESLRGGRGHAARSHPGQVADLHRRISRYPNEIIMDRKAQRLVAQPALMNLRRQSMEYPFGSTKQWMGQGAFRPGI